MPAEVAIVKDPLCWKHSNGTLHPESPDRLSCIDDMLKTFDYQESLAYIPGRDATFDELARIHQRGYIRRIEKTKGSDFTRLDPDTSACSDSFDAAVRAAGCTITAVDSVLSGGFKSAFALVRPPGHHAEAGWAMGFCLFNNIAIGAGHANALGLSRVLILDWDIHHGNGTQNSFYDSEQVLYFSIHEYPHYPGTGRMEEVGRSAGKGYTVNVPLCGGLEDSDYLAIFKSILNPIASEFDPDLILVSAGFDAHRKDSLSSMRLTENGYGAMTAFLRRIAEEHCNGRIVFVLEGGYDLTALSQSISRVLTVLTGKDRNGVQSVLPGDGPTVTAIIKVVSDIQKTYWKSIP